VCIALLPRCPPPYTRPQLERLPDGLRWRTQCRSQTLPAPAVLPVHLKRFPRRVRTYSDISSRPISCYYLRYSSTWLDSTSARAHSSSRTTRTTITYSATMTITTTLHLRLSVPVLGGPPARSTRRWNSQLGPIFLQWLRATVGAYYISKAGVFTIIKLLLGPSDKL